jgi:hypothetical protein
MYKRKNYGRTKKNGEGFIPVRVRPSVKEMPKDDDDENPNTAGHASLSESVILRRVDLKKYKKKTSGIITGHKFEFTLKKYRWAGGGGGR